MNKNTRNERERFSADWVKSQLKVISEIEPPHSLRDGLVAGIPLTTVASAAVGGPWRRWWAGAAAAVVIAVSVAAWFGAPWGRQMRSAIDANSGSGRVYADHNSLRPSDTNLYDINSLR